MSEPIRVSFTTDADAFAARLKRWASLAGKRASEAVMEEGVALSRILAVPPSGMQPSTPPASVGQGKRAVERDVLRAIKPITQASVPRLFARSIPAQKRARKLIASKDHHGMENFLAHTYPGIRYVRASEFKSVHRAKRDSRGRVRLKRAYAATMDVKPLRDYIRTGPQENVGMARGGWSSLALAKGKSIPGWVAKHSSQGTFEDGTRRFDPFIVLSNRSPWAGYRDETNRIMRNALGSRSQTLASKIRAILEGR